MRTLILAAATAAIALATPLSAQSQQEHLDARYDRALAAGYKALMLCGAIGNAQRVGQDRSAQHVADWELNGIQPPLDSMVRDLPFSIVTNGNGVIDYVAVEWATDSPARFAQYRGNRGCALMPIGQEPVATGHDYVRYQDAILRNWHQNLHTPVRSQLLGAMGDVYGEGSRTTSVIIASAGDVVDEISADGFGPFVPQRTWSVAKSIAATLVGAAVFRGEANVNASAGLGVGEGDPRRAITIDHLLRMASGRYSDTPGNRTDPLYFGGATVAESAGGWPLLHAPGTVFRYANNDTLMAIAAIEGSFDQNPVAEQLLRLDMTNTTVEADWQGGHVLSSQVWASPFDLLRFGQLYLNDGKLPDGTRILPEGWVQYVSTPAGPQPDGPFGYGAGFWLMNKSEGVPSDTFAAFGNRGQYVVIVPSRDVVIVRRGEDPVGARFDIAAFTRDVLAALEDE